MARGWQALWHGPRKPLDQADSAALEPSCKAVYISSILAHGIMHRLGLEPGCNNVSAMKPQAPTATKTERDKLRFGLPGSSTERKGRIKAAIQANRETLRRLAK